MNYNQLKELKELCTKEELINIIASQQVTVESAQNELRHKTNKIAFEYCNLESKYKSLRDQYDKLKQCEEHFIDCINKREEDVKHIKELENKVIRQKEALRKLQEDQND